MLTSYVPWAFFYPADNNPEGKDRSSLTETETFELLQTSLSKTLAYYYPLAGRLKNNSFVDCNDMGVQLTEARIKCSMSEILKQENSHLKDLVFPRLFFTDVIPTDTSLLIAQVSFFNCGGVAVALCASHKVIDASTTSNFMNDWSSMARTLNDHVPTVPTPLFNGASLFPPVEDSKCSCPHMGMASAQMNAPEPPESFITRRFLFQSAKIYELKNIAVNSSGVRNPTRYEVVTALLFRCAVAAAKANSGSFQPSVMLNAVNLRRFTVPPLPNNLAGNALTSFSVSATKESHMKFSDLIHQIRNKKLKLYEESNKGNDGAKDGIPSAQSPKTDPEVASERFDQIYLCSSWCGYPFYDVDFRFGKPVMVCDPSEVGIKNRFFLGDVRDGDAVEAAVTLDQTDMYFFQGNEELLAFASLIS